MLVTVSSSLTNLNQVEVYKINKEIEQLDNVSRISLQPLGWIQQPKGE